MHTITCHSGSFLLAQAITTVHVTRYSLYVVSTGEVVTIARLDSFEEKHEEAARVAIAATARLLKSWLHRIEDGASPKDFDAQRELENQFAIATGTALEAKAEQPQTAPQTVHELTIIHTADGRVEVSGVVDGVNRRAVSGGNTDEAIGKFVSLYCDELGIRFCGVWVK